MTTTTEILIIEDDPIMREALAEWLEGAGYGVRKAADGSAGLAAVKSAAPALDQILWHRQVRHLCRHRLQPRAQQVGQAHQRRVHINRRQLAPLRH